jgi:hypothetical protein
MDSSNRKVAAKISSCLSSLNEGQVVQYEEVSNRGKWQRKNSGFRGSLTVHAFSREGVCHVFCRGVYQLCTVRAAGGVNSAASLGYLEGAVLVTARCALLLEPNSSNVTLTDRQVKAVIDLRYALRHMLHR